MESVTGLLVYVLCWWMIWFMVLPIGIRTQDESDEGVVPGTPKSAPVKPRLLLKLGITTVAAGVVWLILYSTILTNT